MAIAIPVVDAVLQIGGKLIDKLFPDPGQKAAAQLALLELAQKGEFKQLDVDLASQLAQVEVNKIEAASSSFFKGGWRPAVGWVCVIGLFYNYLLQPLLAWYSSGMNIPAPPTIELGDLIVLLAGLLGLGTMRMTERLKGKA